jgi:hypothetical protein
MSLFIDEDVKRWCNLDGETLFEELNSRGLGDGLPVVRITEARLSEMLGAANLEAHSTVAIIPPLNGIATGSKLAACAVLAGCSPAVMPLVVAAAIALTRPELNALGVTTTTGSAAIMTVVNGPIRHTAALNADANCLGPGNRSNATLGRCVSLIPRLIGGAHPGLIDMATMGQPAKYGFCFAENEESNPWLPMHVERGFALNMSTVTLIGVSGTTEVVNPHVESVQDMVQSLATVVSTPSAIVFGDSWLVGGGQPTILLTPEWAAAFAAAGLSKDDVKQRIFKEATYPFQGLPSGTRDWALSNGFDASAHGRLKAATIADDILIVVAGGFGIKQTVIPNWNGSSRAVTVGINAAATGTAYRRG